MIEAMAFYVVEVPLEIKQGYTFAEKLITELIDDVNAGFDKQQEEALTRILKECAAKKEVA